MNVTPILLAVRAISAEFAQRIYLPVVILAGSLLVILLSLLGWLTTVSGWWWIALVPAIFFSLLFTFAAVVAGILLRVLRPSQTKNQRAHVRSFVDAIQSSTEIAQTPKFILLFRLVKDMIFPSKKGLVREVSTHATSLKPLFQTIVDSFSNR